MDVKQIAKEITICPSLTDSTYYNDRADISAKIALVKEVRHRWGCKLREAKDAVELSWVLFNDVQPRHSLQIQRTVLREAIDCLESSPYALAAYVQEGIRVLREVDGKIDAELRESEV